MDTFACPICKAAITRSPELIGKTLPCPACKFEVCVPSLPGSGPPDIVAASISDRNPFAPSAAVQVQRAPSGRRMVNWRLPLVIAIAAALGLLLGYSAGWPEREQLAKDKALLQQKVGEQQQALERVQFELAKLLIDEQDRQRLSEDAKVILLEMARSPDSGMMLIERRTQLSEGKVLAVGGSISVGGKSVAKADDPRSEERWISAVQELRDRRLIRLDAQRGYATFYMLTKAGFDKSDLLLQRPPAAAGEK